MTTTRWPWVRAQDALDRLAIDLKEASGLRLSLIEQLPDGEWAVEAAEGETTCACCGRQEFVIRRFDGIDLVDALSKFPQLASVAPADAPSPTPSEATAG